MVIMDIQARIDELTKQQTELIERQQTSSVNIQRLAGAIAALAELLTIECLCECHDCKCECHNCKCEVEDDGTDA